MNCENKGGINDCYWNVDSKYTCNKVTRNTIPDCYLRDWDSKQKCGFTQLGVHVCSAYLSEGSVR